MLLAIPIDQGTLTDFEPLGDAAQAPALSPEFEELIFGVGVIHNGALFRQSVIEASGAQEESSTGFWAGRRAQESELH
jgi:hypothetical protein